MSKMIMTIQVAQQHSAGPITVTSTYTSDGVIVKQVKTRQRPRGRTLDNYLAVMVRRGAVDALAYWLDQEPLF